MKRLTVTAAVVCLMGFFGTSALAQNLDISIPLPLTGAQAKFGEIMKRSYEIAAEEINQKGGIKGKKLVITFEDSQGKPEIARAITEKIIDVKKQMFVIGEYSSACTKAVAAVAEERKLPYLVTTGSADEITQQNYKYVFRFAPSTAFYSKGLISFMAEVVKPKTMAILFESSDFGTAGANDMVKDAEKLGIKIVVKEKYEKGAVDFKPILSKVKKENPDVVYMVSYVMDAALLMRQIKELRIDSRLFAGGAAGFSIPEFIDNAKDAANFVVTATLWSPQVNYPGARDFAEKYKAKYGTYPSYHGAETYAGLYVMKYALERASNWTPDDIRNSLSKVDLMTVFGPVKFENKYGYQNQSFIETLVLQVIKGKFETIWPKKFASAPYVYPIPQWKDRK